MDIYFFEYGEYLKTEAMLSKVRDAELVEVVKVKGVMLTFTGKHNGLSDLRRKKDGTAYGVLYKMPFNKTQTMRRLANNYFSTRLVKVKAIGKSGKEYDAVTIVSDRINPKKVQRPRVPHSSGYAEIADGYMQHGLNLKRLSTAIEWVHEFFPQILNVHKKVGGN